MTKSVHEAVASQYEKWVYPFPIQDLSAPEHRHRRDGADPSTRFWSYWPCEEFRDDMDILIAGCGSNAAARYAYNHPQAKITGIDLSTSSLAHEAYLKDKHGLQNLTLHQCPIEDVASLGQTFDFIDTSGVLHHLPDPVAGLRALKTVLRPNGVIAVMLYGKYSRTGVYMLQEMFQTLGLGQTEDDVATVKAVLGLIPQSHFVRDYLKRAKDTQYDAGLVDTFLHPQDRAYRVADCLEFVDAAGMKFMGWWDSMLYYPEGQIDTNHSLCRQINALPEAKIWQVMELFNGTLGQHAFFVCHPERPEATYKPDFNSDALMSYIPVARGTVEEDTADNFKVSRKPYATFSLQPVVAQMYRQIDGKKTVSECFDAANVSLPANYDKQSACSEVFKYLWRLSLVFLRMSAG